MDPDRKSSRLRYTVEDFKKTKERIIPLCQVKELNGKPAIFLDGKPLAGIAFQGAQNGRKLIKKLERPVDRENMGLLPYIRVNLRENYDCIYPGYCYLNNGLLSKMCGPDTQRVTTDYTDLHG